MTSIEWSVAERPKPGQQESGDRCVVEATPDGALVAVIDGLGHGEDAAAASVAAAAALRERPGESPRGLIERCHRALRGTRGVVMTVATVRETESLEFVGVGNIDGFILFRKTIGIETREVLFAQPGVVGYRLPNLRPRFVPFRRGDLLVLSTDGIDHSYRRALDPNGSPQEIAERALRESALDTDDALILVARRGEVVA